MSRIDLTRVGKGSPVIDHGYVKYAGNPMGLCSTADRYGKRGREIVGSVVDAVGAAITDMGDALSAFGQDVKDGGDVSQAVLDNAECTVESN